MAAKIALIDIIESKTVPEQGPLTQISFIMILREYERFEQCKTTKMSTLGALFFKFKYNKQLITYDSKSALFNTESHKWGFYILLNETIMMVDFLKWCRKFCMGALFNQNGCQNTALCLKLGENE